MQIIKRSFYTKLIKISSINITKQIMSTTNSFCHNISAENYFHSPKMPVKDHLVGLRKTMSSFKRPKSLLDNVLSFIKIRNQKPY